MVGDTGLEGVRVMANCIIGISDGPLEVCGYNP